jgi:glycosyltransferase involved in cell wall biosynthesis
MSHPSASILAAPFLTRRDRPLILYVVQQHDYSGAELMHLPVLQADADPLLACPPGSRTEALARGLGIPTVALPYRPLRHSGGPVETLRSLARGLASVRDLRRILRERSEREVIYCTSLRPGMLAGLAKLGLRRKAMWAVTDLLPPAPLGPLTRLLARAGCDRAVSLSRYAAEDFIGRSPRLRSRTSVAYPGVDLDRFEPESASPGIRRAGIVGHVSPTKRTDLALEIAARVAAEEPDFELVVLGRAQYRDEDFALERELREMVSSGGRLEGHVRFQGYVEDVPRALSMLGLLLHCRPDEPLGIALIEAMAAGIPVVAPASGGPAEIVEDGVTGLLFAPGDVGAAAGHILRLLRQPEEATRMGRAAREAAERRFATDAYLRKMDAVLAEMAGGP